MKKIPKHCDFALGFNDYWEIFNDCARLRGLYGRNSYIMSNF